MLRRTFWLILGAVAFLAMLELVLRILPTPTATRIGQYVDPYITTYPPGHEFRSATGWSLLNAHVQRANDHGFIPDRSFEPAAGAIALIGDSLVEQSMLPPDRRLAAVLQDERGGVPVFSMGIPGSSLLDYLERVRYARDKLGVKTFWIVIERADVRQSVCAGGVFTDACLDTRGEIRRTQKSPRSAAYDLLARSALLQYFVGVLRLSPQRLAAIIRTVPSKDAAETPLSPTTQDGMSAAPPTLIPGERQVIDRFVHELTAMSSVQVGLLIDPQIRSLDRISEFRDATLAQMILLAQRAGIPVVHPLRALARYSAQTGLDMRVGPYDGHWNARANCIIAREALRTLPHPATSRPTGQRNVATLCDSLVGPRSGSKQDL